MYADDTDCLSCSDCRLEFIEKKWTGLLLNWLNKCVHPKAPIKELNPWSMVEVLKKYRQDICADEVEGAILYSDIEAFVRYKYPLLRLRYYDLKEIQKKMYLLSSIMLFHCCVSSITGIVDGDICGNLNKYEQELILKFCEKLMDMEVTCHNIELAVKEAFDSVKQDPRTYRKNDHIQKPSKMKSEPSESCYSTPEMPLSSFNLMAANAPPTEGMKQKSNAFKFKSAESESYEQYSTSDIPLSSLNSIATDPGLSEKNNSTFHQGPSSFDQGTLADLTPYSAAGKSPTGSMKQKITATYKSVEYESYVPCSSSDRPSHISKALCKSPTGSMKKKINTTIKTVQYESYVQCPAPNTPSYNPKALEKSPTGPKKQGLNAKSEAKDEFYESCSSAETASSKFFDKSSTGSMEQRLNAKSKAKAKYKSYESSSQDRYPCNSKAVNKRKKKNPKSKEAKYKSKSGAMSATTPVISIMTTGKSPTDQKFNSLKFKSSVTVLPSVVTTDASYSEIDYVVNYGSKSDTEDKSTYNISNSKGKLNVAHYVEIMPTVESGSERRCLSNCACSRCSPNGQCCADPGNSMHDCNADEGTAMNSSSDVYYFQPVVLEASTPKPEMRKYFPFNRFNFGKKRIFLTAAVVALLIMIGLLVFILTRSRNSSPKTRLYSEYKVEELSANGSQEARIFQPNSYICKQGLCQKVYEPTSGYVYSSLSRCILLCMGPQLWPYPIGYTYYSKKIVVLATNRLEYKFQAVPSEAVHMYLAEAFKLFLGDLAKLERYTLDVRRMNITRDSMIKKMYIQMDVETDPDPRIRVDTDESYTIKVDTVMNQVVIKLFSASFCGIRHALETLSQLILLDQTTGNLITLSNMIIKDAPTYKYRGLMLDTGRNYIPVPDIMRTIDAMASVKLNTFHWRVSDVTSFPLYLPAVPQLFEHGSYDRSLVYNKDDVKAVVRRAGIRGIRILLEVTAPGPVGRAWSWISEATCPTKNKNFTCNNVLCIRLGIHDSVFDILQVIYSEILEMTKVDDIFHLSDSLFSMTHCYYLMEEREGFLEKALERLKLANKGFLPKLPIIWYSTHLMKDYEAKTWDRFGVQLTEWQTNPSDQFLSRFKVIHSSRWDLSCEVKKQRCKKYRTWQEMYSWKSWRNLEVFTIEGGEAILWTDLVDTGNLDYHLWPRTAAVAERLWSDIVLNATVTSRVYVRLDSQRWRMVLKSVQVQPIWPLYCSFSPGVCLEKIKNK